MLGSTNIKLWAELRKERTMISRGMDFKFGSTGAITGDFKNSLKTYPQIIQAPFFFSYLTHLLHDYYSILMFNLDPNLAATTVEAGLIYEKSNKK